MSLQFVANLTLLAALLGAGLVASWRITARATLLGFLFFFVGRSLAVAPGAVRTTTAVLFLTFTLANVVGALAGAGPVDRFDKRAVILAANGVVAVGLIGLLVASTLAWGVSFIADLAFVHVAPGGRDGLGDGGLEYRRDASAALGS